MIFTNPIDTVVRYLIWYIFPNQSECTIAIWHIFRIVKTSKERHRIPPGKLHDTRIMELLFLRLILNAMDVEEMIIQDLFLKFFEIVQVLH